MNSPKNVPLWILIVSGLFALMEIGVSLSMCFAPESVLESVLETVDLTVKGVLYLVYMWAARQFALGFILAFATFKRSVPMLSLSYIFLLVMFAGDLLIGIHQKENAMIITAIVMCLISTGLLYAVTRKIVVSSK